MSVVGPLPMPPTPSCSAACRVSPTAPPLLFSSAVAAPSSTAAPPSPAAAAATTTRWTASGIVSLRLSSRREMLILSENAARRRIGANTSGETRENTFTIVSHNDVPPNSVMEVVLMRRKAGMSVTSLPLMAAIFARFSSTASYPGHVSTYRVKN